VFRPTVVHGLATGNPMNVSTVIGAYAAIFRKLGLPLRFPGSAKAYGVLNQAVDAGLIGRATPYRDVAAWPFGEFVLQQEFDHVLDTTKLRAHGFDGFEDIHRMLDRQFAQMQRERIIPHVPTGAAA
jgi:hypothetical protein